MSYIMVDVETDGPIPADYSMICFGAIIIDEQLDKTFYAQLKPISEQWISKTLEVSGLLVRQRYLLMNRKSLWNVSGTGSSPIRNHNPCSSLTTTASTGNL